MDGIHRQMRGYITPMNVDWHRSGILLEPHHLLKSIHCCFLMDVSAHPDNEM